MLNGKHRTKPIKTSGVVEAREVQEVDSVEEKTSRKPSTVGKTDGDGTKKVGCIACNDYTVELNTALVVDTSDAGVKTEVD